jgi:ribose transport system ATP-binding protein
MSRLSISGVEKSFGALKVLHGVSMTVEPGEVHGLLGENGAGKSTLLNILCGVLSPDRGTVQIDGSPVTITSPRAASEAGIAMIHQELQQVPELTVAQNIFLGANLRRGPFTARAAQEAEARRLLAPLDPTIDVTAPVKSLRVAARQLVEIAKALRARAKIIAMDEPTSSLTPAEFEKLAQVVQKLTAEGVSVIYVSHKMDEVFRLCHSATILRDGRFIERVKLPETPVSAVIAKMVGRELVHATHVSYAKPKVILQAENLTGGPVRDVSFTLHQGEVLGIAGLVGSGRTELLRIIAGVDSSTGSLTLNGQAPGQGPRARIAAGLGLLPEERKRDGIIRHRPVTTNVGLPSMAAFSQGGLIAKRRLHARTEALMKEVGLRPLDVTKPIGQFSGGNQQKAIIGRWLAADTQVFLFDEPTRGIDVGAKAEIYALIERLSAEGRSVIVVSSEMPEVIRLSDRVMVMREGRISATLSGPDITEANIAHNAIPA